MALYPVKNLELQEIEQLYEEVESLRQQVRGVRPLAQAYMELEKKYAESQNFVHDLEIRLSTCLEVEEGGIRIHPMQCEECDAFYDQATRPCQGCAVAQSVCQICCPYPNIHKIK